jgi:hypothetical protein
MNDFIDRNHTGRQLHCAIVLRIAEETCEVLGNGQLRSVRYAPMFPSPRTERVQPGNVVAVSTCSSGQDMVLWRWYDAVVLGEEQGAIGLWEPAHGEVMATPRAEYRPVPPGARAYLSAGLPGADWWVAGPAVADAKHADVEVSEVQKLYTDHGLWDKLD